VRAEYESLVKDGLLAYVPSGDVLASGVFDFERILPVMEEAYAAHYKGDFRMPNSEYLRYDGRPSYDRIISLLGYLGGPFGVSGVKEICSSTENRTLDLPRASGLIILNDPGTQRPFAILEASKISAARTAAVTGLAIRFLRPGRIGKVAFIGCGFLARIHAMMWSQLYSGECGTLHVFDARGKSSREFVSWLGVECGLKAVVCRSAEEAVRNSDLIVPMTTAEEPYIKPEWVKGDSLYSAVSLLDPELGVLEGSDCIVVDDERLCRSEGRPMQRLEQAGGLRGIRLHTMGEVICRGLRLRDGCSRIFFNPMGTVITDLALASHVLENARRENRVQYLRV